MLIALGALACSSESPCQPIGKAPVIVTVTDAANGAQICDALVTIKSSESSQRFASCPYSGGIGPAPYTVTVEKAGYATSTVNDIQVPRSDNGCPAQTHVAVKLDSTT